VRTAREGTLTDDDDAGTKRTSEGMGAPKQRSLWSAKKPAPLSSGSFSSGSHRRAETIKGKDTGRSERASVSKKGGGAGSNPHEDGDADADDDLHLGVLPPHGLADLVGATPEALSGDGEVVASYDRRKEVEGCQHGSAR